MSRPPLEADPQYADYKARIEPLKGLVDRAKADAARDIERAKDRVEAETLAIVREAIEAGYSQYAVGKLVGKTRSEDQKRLIERAMGINWVPNGGKPIEGTETCMGWTWGPYLPGGWTPYVSPEGERFEVGFNAEQYVEWHKPDGSIMSHDERNELPLEVEMFAQEKMENA